MGTSTKRVKTYKGFCQCLLCKKCQKRERRRLSTLKWRRKWLQGFSRADVMSNGPQLILSCTLLENAIPYLF